MANSKNKKAFYAQSGGVTAVINATACGVIEKAREHGLVVYAGENGILGALHEELIDTSQMDSNAIAALRHTPGGAFGSCRHKLPSLTENHKEFERLLAVFAAHDIGYFFYNGGGDSQDTVHKMAQFSREHGYPLQCIGIPKTIDNDLWGTDVCPGFASTAKYVATSILEASLDVKSMARTSTKVFILEVMGRHTGWIAAAAGLAQRHPLATPHLILFPEITFEPEKFLSAVDHSVQQHGFCTIVASEGIRNSTGHFVAESGLRDAFGHAQLGGVAPVLAKLVKDQLKLKYHWAVPDYLQRSARHIAARVDVDTAYALGQAAVDAALAGENEIMMTVLRQSAKHQPYQFSIGHIHVGEVANKERPLPSHYIDASGFAITEECRDYLAPLIVGEDYPPYTSSGLPNYIVLNYHRVNQKLAAFA